MFLAGILNAGEEHRMNRENNAVLPESETDSSPRMVRRTFLAGCGAALLATAAGGQDRDYGQNAPPVRYPEPDVIVLDKRFAKYKIGNTPIKRLYTGMLWAEGVKARVKVSKSPK
jgi:gluconolactonase